MFFVDRCVLSLQRGVPSYAYISNCFIIHSQEVPLLKARIQAIYHLSLMKLCKCAWYLTRDGIVPDKLLSLRSLQAEGMQE